MDATFASLIAGAFAGLVMAHRFIVLPRTRQVAAAAEAILEGGPTALGAVRVRDPRLAAAFGRVAERLASVEVLATTDQLTGVLNRQTSLRLLAGEVERARRHGHNLTVALADIDHFKRVNDTYGHAAGDTVLHQVAQLLRSTVRSTDAVGRYGGEEFVIVLPETEPDDGQIVAEKLRRAVGQTPVKLPDGTELAVTLSIGVAGGTGSCLRLDTLAHDADAALYAAKSLGRDQVQLFRDVDEDRVVRRSPLSPPARRAAAQVGDAASAAAEKQLDLLLQGRPSWGGQPSTFIAELAVGLAHGAGVAPGEVARIRTASLLHDVGKIAIPEELLSKRAALTADEWRIIREHPKTGQIVLEQAGALRDAATIALHHHEWFNGRGYPNGLAGSDIPLGARIVSIADAYDAMTTWRPYKETRTSDDALDELRRFRGVQFDPELVDIFIEQFGHALVAHAARTAQRAAG